MKSELFYLIDQGEEIWEKLNSTAVLACDIDYNLPEFVNWKCGLLSELFGICKLKQDEYIIKIIHTLESPWNGWEGKIKFDQLKEELKMLKSKAHDYYISESVKGGKTKGEVKKTKKIFISHSSEDKKYAEAFVHLLETMGLDEKTLFCSSVPGFWIRTDDDIYDAIKAQFEEFDIHIFYLLSENYYNSPACLNEMGAAWMMQSRYSVFLLPGFEFKKIEGAINPRRISIKFDEPRKVVRTRLSDIKDDLIEELKLQEIPSSRWEEKRDIFLDTIYGVD